MILDFNLTTEQTGGTEKTKLSEFTNDVGFVTNAASDLINYYLKSETYTQAEINQLVAGKITFEVVDELPEATALTMNKIYLVPSAETKTRNVRDEYITIDKGAEVSPRYDWELIGSTRVDLSNYYNKTETDTLLGAKENTISDLSTIRSGAALGATALQSVPNTYRTSADQDVIDSGKQATLVSGTNIKTVNNTSLLGSGNISIETPNPLFVTYINNIDGSITSSKTSAQIWQSFYDAAEMILAVDLTLSATAGTFSVAFLTKIEYETSSQFEYNYSANGKKYLRTITVTGSTVTIDDKEISTVAFTQTLQSGTKIGEISIDGTTSYIYAPDSSKVTFSQTLSSGSEIGQLTIDGTTSYLYAPAGGASTDEIEEVISKAIYDTRNTRPTTSYVNGMITNALSGIIYDGVDAAYTNRALSARQGKNLQQQIDTIIYDSYTTSYALNYIAAYLGINI